MSVTSQSKNEKVRRVAIVTGGARGIGRAIAETMSDSGHEVVVADSNEEEGMNVSKLIHGHFIKADLARRADCENIIKETIRRFGKVDILINNAGFQHLALLEDFPEDIWDQMLSVMLTAPFLLTKYVWPSMKAQRWGRVVNISSIHGLVASQFKSAYVVAKTGLLGLTRASALEGGGFGITVNAICPAYARTKLIEGQIAEDAKLYGIPSEDVVERIMLELAAIKRLVEPEEIASLVQFLCSDAASAITGVALPIDLGWTAR